MNKGLLLFLILLTASSCGIFRKTTAEGALPERNAKFLLKKMAQQQVSADWFSSRAKISYEDDELAVSASANIRMRKDSVIWANIKKLNIEAGRALIRPDSFFVIDRINRQYTRQPVSDIANMLQLPASFELLQTILLGNPFFFTTDLQVAIEGPNYSLSGEDNRFSTTYLLDGRDFLLKKIAVSEKESGRTVEMELSQYGPLDKKQKFSYIRILRMDSPETGPLQVEIEFSKVELNIPKNIEFEIPSRYTEIN
ncbi:MAG: DUF4292 domain-containing protein [Saprospiraceae bacterium]